MIFEETFNKITGPKRLYGYVRINANYTSSFSYSSLVKWPDFLDSTRYEECIIKGIKDALSDCGFSNFNGSYKLEAIRIADNVDDSAPIAYYWAAKNAVTKFLRSSSD